MVNDLTDVDALKAFNTTILFRTRPIHLPADLRPTWRIGLIAIMLKKACLQSRSSLQRLHVLNWGMSSVETRLSLQRAVRGDALPDSILVRFDPFLSRAIDFAIGERLVVRRGGKAIELSASGKLLAEEIVAIEGVYAIERQFLQSVGYAITEKLVTSMFKGSV